MRSSQDGRFFRDNSTVPENVLELSIKNGISVYDSEYVSLAISLGAYLVTADRELLRKFPGVAVSMEDSTNYPSHLHIWLGLPSWLIVY